MPPNGRPKADLEALKPEILRKYHTGSKYDDIAFEVGVSERTLKRRFKEWGIHKRAPKVKADDAELRAQVAIFFIGNLSDDEIAFGLEQQGWRCTQRQVARIRKSQGLLRRYSAFQRQAAVKALWDVIQQELDTGSIEGYRRRLLQVYFKRLRHYLLWLEVYTFILILLLQNISNIILVIHSLAL